MDSKIKKDNIRKLKEYKSLTTFVEHLPKFYHHIIRKGYLKFKTLDPDNLSWLDNIAFKYRAFYLEKCQGQMIVMATTLANKFLSLQKEEIPDPNALLYVYIKAVDPELKLLSMANSCASEEERVQKLKTYFGWYDKTLVSFEKHLNERLHLLPEPDQKEQLPKR